MNGGASIVDRVEQIKWWDAADALIFDEMDTEDAMQMARECQHPDAQWLAGLFPAGGDPVTREGVMQAMLERGEDPRAMYFTFFLCRLGNDESLELLERAATKGYAPAQALLASHLHLRGDFETAEAWAEKAVAAGDRFGMQRLASFLSTESDGRSVDEVRAIALFKESAALGESTSMYSYGKLAFGELDWERFYWWGRASFDGYENKLFLALIRLLPSFEQGENGRILHTGATVIEQLLDVESRFVRTCRVSESECEWLQRVVALHKELLGRAKVAIDCWSMAARRLGVVKDMRVMIAKMAWEEAWQWGEKEMGVQEKKIKRG
jgi:hypothetical protein